VDTLASSALSERTCARLLEAATPDLYRRNAFRVLGLPVTASGRDIRRREQRLRIAERLGVAAHGGNGGYLPLDPPPTEEDIRNALQRLYDPETRLLDEFFWFWPRQLGSVEEDDGLALLAHGRQREALALWLKHERDGGRQRVSTHNLAVFYHAVALDLEHRALAGTLSSEEERIRHACWERAFRRWRDLSDDEPFWSRLRARVRDLDDPRLTTGLARRLRESLGKALLLVNARMAVQAAEGGKPKVAAHHVAVLWRSGFPGELITESLRDSVGHVRQRVTLLCGPAKEQALANPERAHRLVRLLLKQAKPPLALLDRLLPDADPMRQCAHDDVADCALQCQVIYGNATEDWRTSLKLLEKVLPVAASESTRSRLEQNIDIVKDNIKFGLCFFCEDNPPDEATTIVVEMYGNVMRTPVGYGQIRITWQNCKVRIPRCAACARDHQITAACAGGFTVLGIGLGALGFFAGGCAGVIAAIVGGGAGYGIGYAVGRSQASDVRPLGERNEFPLIQELVSQGWQFGSQPSTQS